MSRRSTQGACPRCGWRWWRGQSRIGCLARLAAPRLHEVSVNAVRDRSSRDRHPGFSALGQHVLLELAVQRSAVLLRSQRRGAHRPTIRQCCDEHRSRRKPNHATLRAINRHFVAPGSAVVAPFRPSLLSHTFLWRRVAAINQQRLATHPMVEAIPHASL